MSFLIRDNQQDRHAKIRFFLSTGEPAIAVLLATVDLEWTLRRAILAMGHSPTRTIRRNLLKRSATLGHYKRTWAQEVTPRFKSRLPDVIKDWAALKEAYHLRQVLLRGIPRATGYRYGADQVNRILHASVELTRFAATHNIDLFGRSRVRRGNRQA